jgi:hypothetical protein
MKKKLIITTLCIFVAISTYADAQKGSFIYSDKLSEWCLGDISDYTFCVGYLMGVYESTKCNMVQETPKYQELQRVFLKWMVAVGDKRFIGAQISVKAAFKKEYGCE